MEMGFLTLRSLIFVKPFIDISGSIPSLEPFGHMSLIVATLYGEEQIIFCKDSFA